MTRDDVVRITEDVLRNLSIEIKDGDFTNPNNRTVMLMYRNQEISRTWFDVVQKGEYDG